MTPEFGILRDLQPLDMLVLRASSFPPPEYVEEIVNSLRKAYNWKGVLLQLPPGFRLEHMAEADARRLYEKLRRRFQPKLLLPGDGRGL